MDEYRLKRNNKKISIDDYTLNDMKTVCHYDLWSNADYNISKKELKFYEYWYRYITF